MKITGLKPIIIAKDATPIRELFNDLGFETAHSKNDIAGRTDVTSEVLKDGDGHGISMTEVPQMPADVVGIDMNVDNIEEALKIFEAHGFFNTTGKIEVTATSKTASLASAKGLMISVTEHLK